MIEAEKLFSIEAPIDDVWDYVRDIEKWAMLLPGCRECVLIDDHHSRWTIKVGAGGLVKTVNVVVNVEKWDGPERVNFTYKLESEPVIGGGQYVASKVGPHSTDIRLQLRVEGSGPMAQMWEAVCKPLFHPLASNFTEKLKMEIELFVGLEPSTPQRKSALLTVFSALFGWIPKLWQALTDAKKAEEPAKGNELS